MSRKQARFGQPAVYNASSPSLTDGDDSALNVDSSGNLLVSIATSGIISSTLLTGQATVNTTQVQVTATSKALVNGIVIKSLSTNSSGGIYVGLTGVTTSTGDLIEPGERVGYPVANANLLYIISAASTTDKVTFEAS